jgi:ketosteroid isomerase-like protein
VSENLDLVRSIYANFDREDYSTAAWGDPNIECVIADGPEPVTLTGPTAMEGWLRDFIAAWEGFRVEVDEYRELAQGRVLALVRSSGGRARASGFPLGQHGGAGLTVYEIRSARVVRVVHYFNRERAFADLGLQG